MTSVPFVMSLPRSPAIWGGNSAWLDVDSGGFIGEGFDAGRCEIWGWE